MCNLWRRDDDGTERLIAVIQYFDLLRLVGKQGDIFRYTWQMIE